MNEILLNILSVVVTAIVIPVISFLGFKISQYLNSKIKDEKARDLLNQANEIVLNAVKVVFQTYVEALKEKGEFNKDAQAIALTRAKGIITSELTEELKNFITQNYGDLAAWITNSIEASIYKLKN